MRNGQTRSRLVVLGALVSSHLPSAALAQGDAAVAPPGQPGQQEQSDEPPPLTSKPAPPIPDVRKPRVPQLVDDEAPSVKPSPVYQPIASPVVDAADTSYSGQIILADIGALLVGRRLVGTSGSNLPLLLGWSLASPVVHGIHGHPGRAGVSLLLHTGLPIIGGLLGYAATSNCSSSQDEEVPCGLVLGLLLVSGGIVAATVIDAAVLARLPDAPAGRSRAAGGGTSSGPLLSVGRSGDISVGWRGMF